MKLRRMEGTKAKGYSPTDELPKPNIPNTRSVRVPSIGTNSMTGGDAAVTMDIPPWEEEEE